MLAGDDKGEGEEGEEGEKQTFYDWIGIYGLVLRRRVYNGVYFSFLE